MVRDYPWLTARTYDDLKRMYKHTPKAGRVFTKRDEVPDHEGDAEVV